MGLQPEFSWAFHRTKRRLKAHTERYVECARPPCNNSPVCGVMIMRYHPSCKDRPLNCSPRTQRNRTHTQIGGKGHYQPSSSVYTQYSQTHGVGGAFKDTLCLIANSLQDKPTLTETVQYSVACGLCFFSSTSSLPAEG